MESYNEKVIKINAISTEDVSEKMPQETVLSGTCDNSSQISADDTNKENKSIYELLEEDIMSSDISDAEKTKRLSRLIRIRSKTVNIMLVGATGSGKSSTINAMFNMEMAKVGVGVDPETTTISKFELDNLVIWDTPGLGDGIERDKKITKDIITKLNENNEDGLPLIDMVIVIIDASSKDLGTSYDLINNVLIPCIGNEAEKRILIALNQSDIAMKGTHWLTDDNMPDDVLKDFLQKKSESIKNRIKEATGLETEPVYYCAGYKEEGEEQRKPYNLTKLLYYIVMMIPKEKRLAIADNINENEDNWRYDDKEFDYRSGTKQGFCDTIWDYISDGAEAGSEIGGQILGIPGKVIGGAVGGAIGAIGGIFGAIFD